MYKCLQHLKDERMKTELEKLERIVNDSQKIGEFLEWLGEQRIYLGKYGKYDYLYPVSLTTEQLLAKYFNINLMKVEREKQDILQEIRKRNK